MIRNNLLALLLLSLPIGGCTTQKQAENPVEVHYKLASEAVTEADKEAERQYVTDSLDLDLLEESGRWQEYLEVWIGLHREPQDSFPATVTASAKRLVARAAGESPGAVKPLVRTLVKSLADKKQLGAAAAIAAFPNGLDITHDQYSRIAQRLMNALFLPGNPAPPVKGLLPAVAPSEKTLLFFYSSSCRTCQQISAEMSRRYGELTGKNIRIVSISADTDPGAFEAGSRDFPWPDRLCDFKGFEGENFVNYDVAGTPVLCLIDRKGVVIDQYGSLAETDLLPENSL